ncbi:hypothetical protein QEG60_003414 [Pluralibacter gergoviae]|uniref:hypothetical protein n=1 Tax=Pluralibacter gergoviae TaxID=61647 RepID=UPI000A397835|nr:hypothetical protein [Pluralibacter gergoviae]EKV3544695.1 hypothetical protein [Pluralibacter gergoviae]EKV9900322.1 hypothetical protein [Pluralibacter gergoviae]EKV9930853.1 hypothetical protein [Pluralibacter gergoviae]HDS1080602.1 hypothetical protein [Pluralibacter gergoviae]
MKYLTALLFLSVMVIAGCGDTPDEKIISDVKAKIADYFEINKGRCDAWRFMKDAKDPQFRNAYFRECDTRISPEELTFSDMKVYRNDGVTAVCGVVSGHTNISRQGMRFVQLWDKRGWAYLQSRYSGGKQPDGEAASFWNFHSRYCKN